MTVLALIVLLATAQTPGEAPPDPLPPAPTEEAPREEAASDPAPLKEGGEDAHWRLSAHGGVGLLTGVIENDPVADLAIEAGFSPLPWVRVVLMAGYVGRFVGGWAVRLVAGLDGVLPLGPVELFAGLDGGAAPQQLVTSVVETLPVFGARLGLDVVALRPFIIGVMAGWQMHVRSQSDFHLLEAVLRVGVAF